MVFLQALSAYLSVANAMRHLLNGGLQFLIIRQTTLHITDLLPAQADLSGASAGIADGEDRDGMAFATSALEAAGTVADDAFEQGAAEQVGGGGKARGKAVAFAVELRLFHY